jgi:hypothetical protein
MWLLELIEGCIAFLCGGITTVALMGLYFCLVVIVCEAKKKLDE